MTRCSCCGTVVGPDNLAWDFEWPDDLARMSSAERDATFEFASRAFLVARGYGAAIRVILPIHLDNGDTSTLGVWMALTGDDPARVSRAAHAGGAAWIGCRFTGVLLNEV